MALVEIKEISKQFDTVQALSKVSVEIRNGEILGLIGENGSGKSTLSSILYGIHSPTEGEIYWKGERYQPKSPLDARKHRISMIVQEKDTIDGLTIAENIFLGEEASFGKAGFVNAARMQQAAKQVLEKVGLTELNPTASINSLNFEMRKFVEIAKALYYEPELIIVDETTTALSQEGREKLYEVMRQLKSEGKTVLFISHDLAELIAMCDRLVVLRDGKKVKELSKEEFSEDNIKKAMVGRQLAEHMYRADYEGRLGETVAMRLSHVETELLSDISLELHEGEILGLGGLSGCGMHEIGRLMAGLDKKKSGSVSVYGRELKGIRHALSEKIGYISKDRDKETLFLSESIQDNLSISAWDLLKKWHCFIFPKDEAVFARKQIENLEIKCYSPKQPVRELSGGNKQKVSFGKLIGNQSKILILDSPTRGVDIGVKTTMYELISNLKKKGYAILIISEELSELIGMCDRILILKDGKQRAELMRSETLRDTDVIDYMI